MSCGHSKYLRQVLLSGLVLSACWNGGTSWAQTRQFDVAPQSAVTGIPEFARQANVQILVTEAAVRGKQTNAVRGSYSVDEALARLLEGMGLQYRMTNDHTIIVASEETPIASADSTRLAAAESANAEQTRKEGEDQNSSSGLDNLQEIVVTAQKREERLKDVPISISVLSGAELDSARYPGIAEALTSVPGVSVIGLHGSGLTGGGAQIAIRGVTASGATLGGANPIGYYIDSVPFGLIKTAATPDSSAYDLQRVEVLRGPQGTLYGANSEGGLVRILTNDPDLEHFDLKARASVSSTDHAGGANRRGDMALNVPFVEGKLGARLVLGDEHDSGWIDSPTATHINDAHIRSGRFKLSAQPTDNLSIGLSAWLSRTDYGALSGGGSGDNYRTLSPLPTPQEIGYDAYGLKVAYEFSAMTLTSQTSYLSYESDAHIDLTTLFPPNLAFLAPLRIDITTGIFTEELVANSKLSGSWQWTAGAFFRSGSDQFNESGPIFDPTLYLTDASKSAAVFGELSRRFHGDKMQWTLGGRYFHDDVNSSDRGPVTLGAPHFYQSFAFNAFTPRAVLTWHPSHDLTVYGSYSQGFRSGNPQDALIGVRAPDVPPMDPDKLHSYEIGAKGNWLDQRVAFETAIYYIDWKNIQQQLTKLIQVAGGTFPLNIFTNAGTASGPGAEVALQLRPAGGLKLGLSAGWNDLTFKGDIYSGGDLAFAKGDRVNLTPQYTLGASLSYSFQLGASGYRGQFSASDNYTSPMSTGRVSGVLSTGEPIQLARASLALMAPYKWTLTLFADNLNNETRLMLPNRSLPDWSPRLTPRTVGVQLEYQFR